MPQLTLYLNRRPIARFLSLLLLLASCTKPTIEPVNTPSPDETSPIRYSLTASKDKSLEISLTWEAEGSPTYRILRASAKDLYEDPTRLVYTSIGETKRPSFKDTEVAPKSLYFYKVQAHYSASRIIESNAVLGATLELSDYEAAYQAYTKLATATGGQRYDVTSAAGLPETIIKLIKDHVGSEKADIVLLMDNTGSMGDDIDAVKKAFNKIIDALPPTTRLGAGGYRDRDDLYVLRFQDLTTDYSVIRSFINKMTANGGGDLPEAVYDAIYGTLTQATWVNKKRIVIVVGDAGPHEEVEKTDHSYTDVIHKCQQTGVEVNLYPILLKEVDEANKGGNG